jgi:hypothetical protein
VFFLEVKGFKFQGSEGEGRLPGMAGMLVAAWKA